MNDLNDATKAGLSLADLIKAAKSEEPIVASKASADAIAEAERMVKAVIEDLAAVATAEGTTAERRKRRNEILARLHTEDALGALAILHQQRWPLFQQHMLKLRSTDGVPKGDIGDLEKAVEGMAERSAEAPNRAGTPLQSLLRDLDPALRLLVPPGYRVDKAGVFAGEDQIAHAPVVIRGVAKALDSGRVRWTIAWQHLGAWSEETVDRATACDGRALVSALAGRGAPVGSHNSGRVVEYLVAFEAFNVKGLKPVDTVSRLGWHGDRYVAGPSDEVTVRLRKARPEGWRTAGTREGWMGAWAAIGAHEVPTLCVYVAASAPVLRFLRLGYCPIVDFFGPSGVGKTTSLAAALSLYGVPWLEDDRGGIGGMWGGSVRGREERAADLWDVPMVLDDTAKMIGRDADRLVGEALYQLHRGASRDLASGHTEPLFWRNVVLSTGEKPAAHTTEKGGAKNRLLSVDASRALPNRAAARAIEDAVRNDYGHLGREIAAAALELGEEELKALHRKAEDRWALAVPEADTRLLQTAALISVAAHLLHAVLGLPVPKADPLSVSADDPDGVRPDGLLLRSLRISAEEADQGERALELVREDLQAHSAAYRPVTPRRDAMGFVVEPHEPAGGWRGVVGLSMHGQELVVVHAPALRALLGRAGHDLDPVVRRWKASGALVHCNHGMKLRTERDGRPIEGYPLLASRLR